jgi:antirestriction protein ArdC
MQKIKIRQNHVDTYQQVTDLVIDALEKGVAIWRKPWQISQSGKALFPQNFVSKTAYKGWNHFYLSWMIQLHQFSSPYFLTFRQAQLLGGSIKKGSKGFPIIKWIVKELDPKAENEIGNEEITDTRKKIYPVTHVVFNADQIDRITFPSPVLIVQTEPRRIAACEAIVRGMSDCPIINEGNGSPAYFPILDRIQMPAYKDFNSPEEYYCTLFHEMIHSTGHSKRLCRKELVQSDGFGNDLYCREELVAEMGAAYLSCIAGIAPKTIDNSVAYIGGWLRKLKDDRMLIISAAARAQAAADYILGHYENDEMNKLEES